MVESTIQPDDGQSAFSSSVPGNCREILAQYSQPDIGKSVRQLSSSLVPFVLLWALMCVSLEYSYWVTILLALPTAGFLVRLFVLQHDCGHGSFFVSKTANDVVGCALGVLTLTPYYRWRKHHAIHHATSGDLDRRGHGDVHILTVEEYLRLAPLKRLAYRVHRNPLVLFVLGPFVYFVITQRFAFYESRLWKKERANVYWSNLALLACVLAMWWFIGLQQFLLVHLPVVALATSAGVWLFYVQHNFSATYWQHHDRWDYFAAGTLGSSYYHLPKVLQWITANIGLHHIHHLDSRIPNYRLQQCFDENPEFQSVNRFTLWDSLSCGSVKLWDEDKARMVGFPK